MSGLSQFKESINRWFSSNCFWIVCKAMSFFSISCLSLSKRLSFFCNSFRILYSQFMFTDYLEHDHIDYPYCNTSTKKADKQEILPATSCMHSRWFCLLIKRALLYKASTFGEFLRLIYLFD